MKIGIIKEGKIPIDKRVALTPSQAASAMGMFKNLKVVVQKSDIRCFDDSEYESAGVPLAESVEDCDILLGVKEVPIPELIAGKTYLFFSHTIKKQPYNRELLRQVLSKKIRLIDYETLLDLDGQRIIAFGRWAGIVGAYNAIWAYGKRHGQYNIRRAHECFDLEDLIREYPKVKLPPVKIAVTGGGRVSKGAMEVLLGMGIEQVTPREFLDQTYDHAVFAQLRSADYHKKKDGKPFDRKEFFEHPERYDGDFLKYTHQADILIAGAYWDPAQPVLFTSSDATRPGFRTRLIADITCDIEGSIPSTKRPSTIDDPIYDYNPARDTVEPALNNPDNITVMAVDNLPCELPRDASESFGHELLHRVLPHLLGEDRDGIIDRATLTREGNLTSHYAYLQDYVDGVV